MNTPTVAVAITSTYGLSMPSAKVIAAVESKVWTDGVVIAAVYGDDERGTLTSATVRGTIQRRKATYSRAAAWLLVLDGEITPTAVERTRKDLLAHAANLAIEAWSRPIAVRIARSERAARALKVTVPA